MKKTHAPDEPAGAVPDGTGLPDEGGTMGAVPYGATGTLEAPKPELALEDSGTTGAGEAGELPAGAAGEDPAGATGELVA